MADIPLANEYQHVGTLLLHTKPNVLVNPHGPSSGCGQGYLNPKLHCTTVSTYTRISMQWTELTYQFANFWRLTCLFITPTRMANDQTYVQFQEILRTHVGACPSTEMRVQRLVISTHVYVHRYTRCPMCNPVQRHAIRVVCRKYVYNGVREAHRAIIMAAVDTPSLSLLSTKFFSSKWNT